MPTKALGEPQILTADPASGERIFEYIGGEELNSSPTQSPCRYVIDFGNRTLSECEAWPELLSRLREKVLPLRAKQKRKSLRDKWWQYADRRPGLYRAIAPLSRCLACSQVTKHCVFAFQPIGRVLSQKLVVFPDDRWSFFGVLQSRIHERWVVLLTSTMRSDLNYSPSDCFETFPFPPDPHLVEGGRIDRVAAELYEVRAQFMSRTEQGLTKTYNALKDLENADPGILHIRKLHEQLDRAVLDAYGQSHIEIPPYCGADPTALERFEDEVLDFLFALNEQRASEETKNASLA